MAVVERGLVGCRWRAVMGGFVEQERAVGQDVQVAPEGA
jgi:hypothetical protein